MGDPEFGYVGTERMERASKQESLAFLGKDVLQEMLEV